MSDEKQAEAAEGATPQDAAAPKPQDAASGEGAKPQDPAAAEGATVNRHQYERDIQRRDERIAELEKRLAESGEGQKTAEQRIAELEKRFADAEARLADEKVNGALAAAGCIDAKAARARLDEFGGDVAKLKEAAPYLFAQEKRQGSTGLSPAGSPGASEERRRKAREAAGLKP